MHKILAIDPSLTQTGWAVISKDHDGTLGFIASNIIKTNAKDSLPFRLSEISRAFNKIINDYQPDEVAIEEVFINNNPLSSLKLGHARGAIIAACSMENLQVYEYAARLVKKSIVGTGSAQKQQVAMMIKILLPNAVFKYEDESDAIAVGITHLHHKESIANRTYTA
jgi:crossover junction endodeoxyribonuclease RuvC